MRTYKTPPQMRIGAKRSNVRDRLSREWIRKHRPDVAEAIDKLALEKFPLVSKRPKNKSR